MALIECLAETVKMHAASGNSTWIMEACKISPDCRVLYRTVALAKEHEGQYLDWFNKEHKRAPSEKERPHFCAIGSLMYHTRKRFNTPLIIDNSCIDHEIIQASKQSAFLRGRHMMATEYEPVVRNMRHAIDTMLLLIHNSWWIFGRKRLLKKLHKIKNGISSEVF